MQILITFFVAHALGKSRSDHAHYAGIWLSGYTCTFRQHCDDGIRGIRCEIGMQCQRIRGIIKDIDNPKIELLAYF